MDIKEIENRITEKLKAFLEQKGEYVIEIQNESNYHKGSTHPESHFKIIILSNAFCQQSLLQRHRTIQKILEEEIALIRAFSLHLFT